MATKRKSTKKRTPKRTKSKSQLAREYAAKHPDAGPSEIAAALKKRGVKASPNLVSMALSNSLTKRRTPTKKRPAKKRASAQKRRRKAATKRAPAQPSLDALLQARKFVDQMGSLDKAQRALDGLRRVIG